MIDIRKLVNEIETKKKDIKSTKISHSFWTLKDLYIKWRLVINPKFQRFFRWDKEQKSNFIESILLWLPIPPIFVSKKWKTWELIDGLQRLSTMFEFFWNLKDIEKIDIEKSIRKKGLLWTEYLPSLSWATYENIGSDIIFDLEWNYNIDVIILEDTWKSNDAKYELFYRLNTWWSSLSNQEVRSAIMIMENETIYDNFKMLSDSKEFLDSVLMSDKKAEKQQWLEYVLRYFSIKNYQKNEWKIKYVKYFLDKNNLKFTKKFNLKIENENFIKIFNFISENFNDSPFRQYIKENDSFKWWINISTYDIIASWLWYSIWNWLIDLKTDKNFIINKIKELSNNKVFIEKTKVWVTSEWKMNFSIKFWREYFIK